MGLLTKLVGDAFELARAMGAAAPSPKQAAQAALSQDGYKVLVLSRVRESARRWHVPGVNHALRLVQTAIYGIEIGNTVELGDGVNFAHTLGTVIGGTSRVGARVKFLGNNTVGTAKDNGCPVIEDDVVVGCGARVLGPIRIGKGAFIGANAVVLSDVPAGAVVSGIPAKVHGRGSAGAGAHAHERDKTNGAE
jgi:serine O-acetyltransferase